MHPLATELDVDALAGLFEREISEGMDETTRRAGVIKVATGESRISQHEEKVLRAAARAHRRTGCPIITHTTAGLGLEQLDLFADEGVPAAAVIISHVGTEPNPLESAERLLERGATICVDEIGYPFFPDEHWVRLVVHAVRAGYGNQVVLGHDAVVVSRGPEELFGPMDVSDYTYISRTFLPKLAVAGLSVAEVHAILVANPARALTFRDA
jgi:phosphotriesterase-related protein